MPLKLGTEMPSLAGASQWVNGEVNSEELKGFPVLVHFWAVSCYLCKNNLPAIKKWRDEYASQGLKVVAIHMPRQQEDTDIELVKQTISDLGITEPCAIDNNHLIKTAFGNDQSWVPAYFLFDAEGKLKSRTAGDAGVTMLKSAMERIFPAELQLAQVN